MQAYNPFLPSCEYVPDGEPHVFDDKIYLYGSHDKFGGDNYCLNDYICYSASIYDLTNWKYEGVIFKKTQDPRNPLGEHALYAPDVAKGLDGRYYLYYCFDNLSAVGVAVCDSPAGRYEYLGLVSYTDGTILGEKAGDYFAFDPGIFVDDDNRIWLYIGNGPRSSEDAERKNSQVIELEKDMVTIKSNPERLIPILGESQGTGFEGHEFFEASSMRKIGNIYYFIYSSILSHELCYATSRKPNKGFQYGGTLISIGDVGYQGKEPGQGINYLGNTHGSIENINGQWYIFYHRQTNQTQFSRQACAEKISIMKDGTIPQAEITSGGLNPTPLLGEGTYPASIACNLQNGEGVTFSHPMALRGRHPYFTQDAADMEPEEFKNQYPKCQYVKNISHGTVIGYKYFDFKNVNAITITVRGNGKGVFKVYAALEHVLENNDKELSYVPVEVMGEEWVKINAKIAIIDGISGLFFQFEGEGIVDFLEFSLKK